MSVDPRDPATWPKSVFKAGADDLKLSLDLLGGATLLLNAPAASDHRNCAVRDIFLKMYAEIERLNAEAVVKPTMMRGFAAKTFPPTHNEKTSLAIQVKEKFGVDAARLMVSTAVGHICKLSDIPADRVDSFIDLCKWALKFDTINFNDPGFRIAISTYAPKKA